MNEEKRWSGQYRVETGVNGSSGGQKKGPQNMRALGLVSEYAPLMNQRPR